MTPSGIEPATCRFVAQHLNHCATTKVVKEDNGIYRNVIGSQIVGHQGAIKRFKRSNFIVLGFTTEVQDETITYTKYKT